ncbi:YoaK family protein [Fulvivirga sp.]|uniref:YoaK family protein n=1 Tax=Fulvivirga sp. TaxID=1931237 RepID=UPI0032EC08AA
MLSKFSNSRSLADNLKLGVLTAFVAGMVNVASLLIFFAFTSNVTGHYAILASEIAKGNLYQVGVVLSWIFLFFFGGFLSNFIVIHLKDYNNYLAHSLPILLEIACLMTVGVYGEYFFKETLLETEFILALMLFAMGLQNGLTASISNFSVKTTHLTGTTTELGMLFSMFTKREFRNNKPLRQKAILLFSIMITYLIGAIVAGLLFTKIGFKVFYFVNIFLLVVITYDLSKVKFYRRLVKQKIRITPSVNNLNKQKAYLNYDKLGETKKEKETLVYD